MPATEPIPDTVEVEMEDDEVEEVPEPPKKKKSDKRVSLAEEPEESDEDLDDELTEDGEDSDAEEEEDEFESEWIAATVLKVKDIVDADTVKAINKYLDKHPRIWKHSSIVDEDDEDDDDDDEDDDEDIDDDEDEEGDDEDEGEPRRSCRIATDTNTLTRYYNGIDPLVQAAVENFIGRFKHFDLVSAFDDYRINSFDADDYRKEAPEKTSLQRSADGAMFTLVAMVMLKDTDANDIHMPLQKGDGDKELWISAKAGDIIVFPACPLHPYAIVPREKRALRMIQVCIT